MRPLDLPATVRLRALAAGPSGEAWLASLTSIVVDLATEWDFELGRTLAGGTEALVVAVRLPDGREAVLKLYRPESDAAGLEIRTILATGGRGYAEAYRWDVGRGALLLERLGPPLAETGLPVDAQIACLCETLMQAWTPPPPDAAFPTGAEKAAALSTFIETTWRALDRPCAERTVELALDHAEARRRAFDPERAVLAHGDPHPWNALQDPRQPARFKFVDPDGLFVEPAYDLGVLMREWTDALLPGDPLALGLRRCRRLAALTGVDPGPIWQWGLIERVSTGLLCLQLGLDGGEAMLAVADAWATAGRGDDG